MSLLSNPFHVLHLSTRDRRQRIQENAENQSLTDESEIYESAKSALINPRTRLEHEMMWLPGVSPKRADQIIQDVQEHPNELLRELTDLTHLARCNVYSTILEMQKTNLYHSSLQFGRYSTAEKDSMRADCIELLCLEFEEINKSELLRLINADRLVAGFSEIQTEEQITTGLRSVEDAYICAVQQSLEHNTDTIKLLVDAKKRNSQIPRLLEEAIDRKRLSIKDELERSAAEISDLLATFREELRKSSKRNADFLLQLEIIKQRISEWNKISMPFQMLDNSRGQQEPMSSGFAVTIRSFAVDIANEFEMLMETKKLIETLKEGFPLLNIFSGKIEEDAKTLDNLVQQQKKSIQQAQIYEELTPLNGAPTLYRINGIGFSLFGESDRDVSTNSYLTTYWFFFFFIPIIPIRRYRVISSDNSYSFLGKQSLSQNLKIWRYIVFGAAALFVIFANLPSNSSYSPAKNYSSSGTPTKQVGTATTAPKTTTTQATQSTQAPSPPSKRDEINALREKLDALKSQIINLENQIKPMGEELDSLKNQIDANKGNTVVYNSFVDKYNDKLAVYKPQYAKYKEILGEHNRLVAQYNVLIKR